MDNTMANMLDLLVVDAYVLLETVQKVNDRRFMIVNRGLGRVGMSGCLAHVSMLKRDLGWGGRDGRDGGCQEEARRLWILWCPLVERDLERRGTCIHREYEGHSKRVGSTDVSGRVKGNVVRLARAA